jgi:hypothetical protein
MNRQYATLDQFRLEVPLGYYLSHVFYSLVYIPQPPILMVAAGILAFAPHLQFLMQQFHDI